MRERGGINLLGLVMLAALVVGGYLGWNLGLPYYRNTVFEEKLFSATENFFHSEPDEVNRYILQTAAESHVALTTKDYTVTQTASEINIRGSYKVPVVTPIYSRTLQFSFDVTRKFSR